MRFRWGWRFWYVSLPALTFLGWLMGACAGLASLRDANFSGPRPPSIGIGPWIGLGAGAAVACAMEFFLANRGRKQEEQEEHEEMKPMPPEYQNKFRPPVEDFPSARQETEQP